MFLWDSGNIDHIKQRNILPEAAEQVIQNQPYDLFLDVRNGEERLTQVGHTDAGRILVVVTTIREGNMRVVTAYPANERLGRWYAHMQKANNEKDTEHARLQE